MSEAGSVAGAEFAWPAPNVSAAPQIARMAQKVRFMRGSYLDWRDSSDRTTPIGSSAWAGRQTVTTDSQRW